MNDATQRSPGETDRGDLWAACEKLKIENERLRIENQKLRAQLDPKLDIIEQIVCPDSPRAMIPKRYGGDL